MGAGRKKPVGWKQDVTESVAGGKGRKRWEYGRNRINVRVKE